jgi:hypothetical protein
MILFFRIILSVCIRAALEIRVPESLPPRKSQRAPYPVQASDPGRSMKKGPEHVISSKARCRSPLQDLAVIGTRDLLLFVFDKKQQMSRDPVGTGLRRA